MTMNKLFKGAVAGTAGIALLFGGIGSFAAWTDTATATPGTIDTGELRLTSVQGTWKDVTMGGNGTDVTTGALFVPGRVWEYTQELTITTAGGHLDAKLTNTFDPNTLALPSAVNASLALALPSGADGITVDDDGSISTIGPGTWTVKASLRVTFDLATADNADMKQALKLGAVKFTLTQVASTPPQP